MQLTTRTANRLKYLIGNNIDKDYNYNISEIINFKNELKELIKIKDKNRPFKEVVEMRLRLNTLIQEIESVENAGNKTAY